MYEHPRKLTAEDIKNEVNGTLRGYPWGGNCVAVRKNAWDEWIVDCQIWSAYDHPRFPKKFYKYDDPETPIRQFMVTTKWFPSFEGDWFLFIELWEAENDMRLPTWVEEGYLSYDEDAPNSPYILDRIKLNKERFGENLEKYEQNSGNLFW